MKTSTCVFLALLFGSICFSQTNVLETGVYTGPTTFTEDPNLNKDWDWEKGDVIKGAVPRYYIFLQNKPNAVEEYEAVTPWHQQSSWTGLEDRKKEDGWILLARDFGSPERRLINTNPYYVLYNPFRAIIRVFILVLDVPTSFTFSTMELRTYHKESGVVAHLAPVAYALDKVQNMYNNTTSAAIPSLALSNYWIYADFPLALDNTLFPNEITNVPASMIFDVFGTVLTDVKLETNGFGAQGDKSFIDDFMVKNNFGSPGFSLNKGNMPIIDIPFGLPNVRMKATAPNWGSMNNFIKNLQLDMNFGAVSVFNPMKGFFDGFSSTLTALSIASPIGISGLDLGGIFSFFVGGGMKQTNVAQTPPTFISSHYSSTGTLTTKNRFASVTVPIPAARQNYKDPFNGGEVGLVRNDPVGIFTLIKTPQIYKRKIIHSIDNGQYDFFTEYEVVEDIQYIINQSANLKLKSMEAYMIDEYDISSETGKWVFSKIDKSNQKYLIRFDNPINKYKMFIKSMPVPYKYFKGRKLHLANNDLSTVKVKIKAILQRKDDANAQPIVFISTYNTEVVDLGGFDQNYVYITMPTIPPQNVVCTIPTSGGVRVSWDRNLENNIKNYFVERSINGGKYTQIGSTADTVFTDNEVQKAVKPYLSIRQNVSVSYRVRAKSEWIDDDGSTKSQLSDYSDIINITGSILSDFAKWGSEKIVPKISSVSQNFPNPFNPTTTIYYGVKEAGIVSIIVFNSLGQEVATLVNDNKEVGYHYAEWNATGLPSGLYFYRITVGSYSETRKMMLMK